MPALAFYAYQPHRFTVACPHCAGHLDLDLGSHLSRGDYPPAARARCPHCGSGLALRLQWEHRVVNVTGRVLPSSARGPS